MPKKPYRYVMPYDVTYPALLDKDGHVLVGRPGDVQEFDYPPDDRWVPVAKSDPKPPKTGD